MKNILPILLMFLFLFGCVSTNDIRPQGSEEMTGIILNVPNKLSKPFNEVAYDNDPVKEIPSNINVENIIFNYKGSYYINVTETDDVHDTRIDVYENTDKHYALISNTDGKIWRYTVLERIDGSIQHRFTHIDLDGNGSLETSYEDSDTQVIPERVIRYSRRVRNNYLSSVPVPIGTEKREISLDSLFKKYKYQQWAIQNDPEQSVQRKIKVNNEIYQYEFSSYVIDAYSKLQSRMDTYFGPFVSTGFTYIIKIKTKDVTWCYMVIQKPKSVATIKENYIVMDFDGDGIWGIKIPDNSRFSIPSWMKKKM